MENEKIKKIDTYKEFFPLRIMEDLKGFEDFNTKLFNYIQEKFGKEFEISDKIKLNDFAILKPLAKKHKIDNLEIELKGTFKFINNLVTRFLLTGNGKGKITYKKLFKKEEKSIEFNFNIDTDNLNYEITTNDNTIKNFEKTLIFSLILHSILNWYREIAITLIKK